MKRLGVIDYFLKNANAISLISVIGTLFMVVITAYSIGNNNHENNKNRMLQTMVLESQLKNQWLDKVRLICTDYIFAFNENAIVEIINGMGKDESNDLISYHNLGNQYDNIGKVNISLLLMVGDSEYFQTITQPILHVLYDDYNSVIMDIHEIAHYMVSHNEIIQQDLSYMENNKNLSGDMRAMIKNMTISSNNYKDHPEWMLKEYMIQRAHHISDLQNDIRALLTDYINYEQKQIGMIINEEYID